MRKLFYKEIIIENIQISKKKHASNKARKGTVVNPLRVPCYDDYSPLKAPDQRYEYDVQSL